MSFLKRYILMRSLVLPSTATVATIGFILLIVIVWTVQACFDSGLEHQSSLDQEMRIQRYEETLAKGRIFAMQLRAKLPTHADHLRDFYRICMEINPGKAAACNELVKRYDRLYWDSIREEHQ